METTQFVDGTPAEIVNSVPKYVWKNHFQGGWNGYSFYMWGDRFVAVAK